MTPNILKPIELLVGISAAVVKVVVDEPNNLVESLRPADVSIPPPIHLGENTVELAREIGGRDCVGDDTFHDYFLEESFPTAGPCISRKALDTLIARF